MYHWLSDQHLLKSCNVVWDGCHISCIPYVVPFDVGAFEVFHFKDYILVAVDVRNIFEIVRYSELAQRVV